MRTKRHIKDTDILIDTFMCICGITSIQVHTHMHIGPGEQFNQRHSLRLVELPTGIFFPLGIISLLLLLLPAAPPTASPTVALAAPRSICSSLQAILCRRAISGMRNRRFALKKDQNYIRTDGSCTKSTIIHTQKKLI